MKILVTGANGFIGKNYVLTAKQQGYDVLIYDLNSTDEDLKSYIHDADFVVHLAGINRPLTNDEFYNGNVNFTKKLLDLLKLQKRHIPLLLSSSIHAESDSDYGKSKKMAEDEVFKYGKDSGSNVHVFRLPNAFGKWCKPNYNSVVATFCYNVINGIELQINNRDTRIPFVYIDDIIMGFMECLDSEGSDRIKFINPVYEESIGTVADLLYKFKECRCSLMIPNMEDGFEKKLYSTYLSYLPESEFSYPLKMNIDERGSFTEFMKSSDRGQVSINVSKPGIIKGNHWHHTKNEKFLVVSGTGIIRFRRMDSADVIEYNVSEKKLEVIDIPTGYTHNIENVGNTDMVTVMWCSELYDADKPDTFFEKV